MPQQEDPKPVTANLSPLTRAPMAPELSLQAETPLWGTLLYELREALNKPGAHRGICSASGSCKKGTETAPHQNHAKRNANTLRISSVLNPYIKTKSGFQTLGRNPSHSKPFLRLISRLPMLISQLTRGCQH